MLFGSNVAQALIITSDLTYFDTILMKAPMRIHEVNAIINKGHALNIGSGGRVNNGNEMAWRPTAGNY
jgi:hypothetical protein